MLRPAKPKPTYYGRLAGGLGNQLFIVAATYALALRRGGRARFSVATRRRPAYAESILRHLARGPVPAGVAVHREPTFRYHAIPKDGGRGLALHGYFQSAKYFRDHARSVRDYVTRYYRTPQASAVVEEAWRRLPAHVLRDDVSRVAVHVRRGDYLRLPDKHPFPGDAYYAAAWKRVMQVTGAPPDRVAALVFSDDPRWCRGDWAFLKNDVKRWHVVSQSDVLELRMMGLCDHHVIANSTFSWWGAQLAESTSGVVVAPSRWFGPATSSSPEDLYCPGWHVI